MSRVWFAVLLGFLAAIPIITPLIILSALNWWLVGLISVEMIIALLPLILFLSVFIFILLHFLISALVYHLALPLEEGKFDWGVSSFSTLFSEGLPMNYRFFLSSIIYRNAVHILNFITSPHWMPNLVLTLFGTSMGKNVLVLGKITDPSLTIVGDNSVIGLEAGITSHTIDSGKLVLKKVKIGKDCVIGGRAVLLPGVEVGDGAVVAAGAVVPKNAKIPAGSVWGGVPAKQIRKK